MSLENSDDNVSMLKSDRKKPVVSIITVTKNAEKYLEQSILSVINQTYSDIEYLVIDGLSDDGTMDILKQYNDYIDVLVSEQDSSMYEAINKAIERSSGDIIAILNSDDRYIDNEVVSRVVKILREFDVDGVYGDIVNDYGDKQKYKKVFQVSFDEYLLSGKGTFVPHITLFLKKHCFDVVGKYDQQYKYAADYDFILRCLDKCKLKYCGIPIAIFRRHAGSITASGKIRGERISVSRKHGYEKHGLLRRKLISGWLWGKYYIINVIKRLC